MADGGPSPPLHMPAELGNESQVPFDNGGSPGAHFQGALFFFFEVLTVNKSYVGKCGSKPSSRQN